MRKTLVAILSVLMLASCGNSNKDKQKKEQAQEVTVIEENTLVKTLDYKNFVKKVWDIETYPDSFAYKGKLPCMIDF